jgi:uncharacterized protein with NAD-binding domain and iron-sulfur cluster
MGKMQYYTEHLQTPVSYHCDVAVCGGGTAGFIAALASAGEGADTVLIERSSFIGGTMINGAGPLHSYYNLFKAFPGAQKQQVVKGLPQKLIDRLVAENASYGHLEQEKGGNYDSVITLIEWEAFKDVAFKMLEEAGVRILLNTMVVGAMKEGSSLTGVIIESKSGRQAIGAKVVIDATGDGDVAALAGADFIKKHDTTSVGFPFGMMNVDMKRLVAYLEEHGLVTQLIRGKKDGDDDVIRLGFDLRKDPRFTEFMNKSGMWGPLGFSYHANNFNYINTANKRNVDATNNEECTRVIIELRHQVMEMSRMLIRYIPGFENAYVNWTPQNLGVRYSRVIQCEYELSVEEIVQGKRFEDEVFLYGFHDCAPRIMIQDAKWYGIPYRALLPKKVDGLLVAGRLITGEWDAHMSTRNTVSCMAQGEAVGTAAALSALQGVSPRELDVDHLRSTLKKNGVYLDE